MPTALEQYLWTLLLEEPFSLGYLEYLPSDVRQRHEAMHRDLTVASYSYSRIRELWLESDDCLELRRYEV